MQTNICPDCGNELPAGLPEGTCPNCLLKLGVRTAAETPQPAEKTTPVPVERPGARIARYKLLEPIGEGGFGTVWLAEQQEPVRRKVALKIIKLGMDTREVIARFEAERQALALMDHPNIARVFDGGATEGGGRPYFVMELVRGVRITDYCDTKHLSTEERLTLFVEVCRAVQHAHQKGVIHRDLKPSNVLVTEQDGRAVPKVIDFGIAKATAQELTEKTLFTRFNQLIGTPAYMSPEQAGLGKLDVDTRSDIYSLGVLLYELLTGRTPFSNEELLNAGLDQVLRIIREQEPPKPSTQLSMLSKTDLSAIAQSRASEPARLNRQVRGELDWIVMKCLEKDRARRYEAANGLAQDIVRHLNNEPVSAAAPSLGYQLGKFALRHRTVLGTAAAFVLVLLAGIVVSTWQAVRVNRFARAETQARREAVTNWLTAQRSLYAADMNLAAGAVDINSLGRATQLLERHRPKPGDPDFRHWEWSYLLRETADHSTYSFHLPGANFNRLGVAPDGRTLAVPCGRSSGVLWDVATRKVRGELPVPCFQAFFSPNSRWVAAVVSQGGRVDVFNAETAELVASIPRYLQLNDVAFSLDESLLATTSDEQTNGSQMTLQLWRWQDKKLVAERGFPSFRESFHYKVAFHPDGKRVAISQYNGGVRLLRLPDLADDRELKIFDQGTGAIAISADGRWLAAGARGSESPIYVWELSNDAPPVILRGHTSEVLAVAFSPDGQWLASGAGDQTVKVWELPQMRLRTTLRGHTSDLRTVGFLAGSAVLVSGDVRADVKLWDLNATFADTNDLFLPPLNLPALTTDFQRFSGIDSNQRVVTGETFPSPKPAQISELGQRIRLAAMSPAGDLIASVDQSNTVRLLRLSDRHLVLQTNPYPASIARLGFVKNGEFLVALTDDGAILRWNKDLQEVRPALMPANFASTKFVLHAGLTINEHDFVFCNTLSGDRVASLEDGRILGSPKASGGYSGGNEISRDGRLFAVGKQDGQVEFYDTGTWERVGEPLNCHSDWISAVAFSPDGRRLATNGHGREPVRLWDVESRQQICTLPIEARGYRFLQFSDDGRSLAFAATSGQIRIITVELPH